MAITDKQYYKISDRAHFLFGLLGVILFQYIGGTYYWLVGAGCVMAFATVKEFLIDPEVETPEEAGSSGWRDWFGYTAGICVGIIIVLLK